MNDIIDWLKGFEETAARLYEKAADRFKDDPELSGFLSGLSNDEKTHRDYLVKAAEVFRERRPATPVTVDRSARSDVELALERQERLLDEGKLTRAGLFDFIVANEYSEWNDLFLFVVNTVKKERGELIPALVTTQQHKRSIERFIGSQPDLDGQLQSLKRLKPVWVEKLLVVDDEEMIAEAVAATLEDEGAVDRAANGKEALEMIGERFYAAVITDIERP
jgi:CheY-like chemotaxis protein